MLVDTNLLLLYFVGLYNPSLIPQFKRTRIFTVNDFDVLQNFIALFSKVVTTPNILTEVSNLSNQLAENHHADYYAVFASRLIVLEEQYVASADVCALNHFKKFGLTDSGIVYLVKDKYLVLTDDFRLSGFLQSTGIDTINFNHIRDLS